MRIGVDLRPLQMGHKFRGIGEVTKQVTDRIMKLAVRNVSQDIEFVFYEYDDDDPKKMLHIPKGLKYSVVKQGFLPENVKNRTRKEKIVHNLKNLYGNPIKKSDMSDVFLQFDYAFGVPTDTETYLIKHDLIPLIFWSSYFESAWVPFKNKAARTTLRTFYANYKYKRILKRGLRRSHRIIAVSENTKNDIVRLFRISPDKITVTHLGVDKKIAKTEGATQAHLPTKPYLLFVGAGDARRRVDDLIFAYNNLKAGGYDIQLALVGENFPSPEAIPNMRTRKAVMESSYSSDILTLGYVDDETKHKLYEKAIAFVYPTRYEGFGIPVLESMLLNCPVITYNNSSIPEVAGDYALYADNWSDIVEQVKVLLAKSTTARQQLITEAHTRAQTFTWDITAQRIFDELTFNR